MAFRAELILKLIGPSHFFTLINEAILNHLPQNCFMKPARAYNIIGHWPQFSFIHYHYQPQQGWFSVFINLLRSPAADSPSNYTNNILFTHSHMNDSAVNIFIWLWSMCRPLHRRFTVIGDTCLRMSSRFTYYSMM